MVGKYRIEVNNKYTKYFLTVQRNFTILQGNSATGKTELIRLLSQYEENGEASGVHVSCDVPVHVLRGRFWEEDIEHFHNSIIFLDESEQYAKTKEFAETAQKNDNYFFIVNRDPLHVGPIPPERLSGGVKTLIMIDHDYEHVFNASACGDNCAKWLLKICETEDRLVRLGYIMNFGDNKFTIKINNTGKIVHSMSELMDELIDHDLL